jgi:hypothetical protein
MVGETKQKKGENTKPQLGFCPDHYLKLNSNLEKNKI